jgi:hypothetical protein
MHEHGPDCLEGPVRGSPAWWRGLAAAHDPKGEEADSMAQKTKKSQASGIRRELVERVRREIQAGTYDTFEKWQAALERLYDHLEG